MVGTAFAVLMVLHAPADVRAYLVSAAQLYQQLEYEHALEQLQRAKALPGRTADDDVEIALYEGIIDAELARDDDANSAFTVALSINPEAKLPLRVSPKVEERFEALRAKMRAQREALMAKPAAAARSWPWAPTIAGAVLLAGGGFCIAQRNARAAQLETGAPGANGAQLVSEGRLYETLGFAGLGLGVAAVATSAIWYFASGSSPVSVRLSPTSVDVAVRW